MTAVERYEAWWAQKQSASFREAYKDMPELHGGDREKLWGSAYERKERVAYLAGYDAGHDAALAAQARRVAELEGALAYAEPALELALEMADMDENDELDEDDEEACSESACGVRACMEAGCIRTKLKVCRAALKGQG